MKRNHRIFLFAFYLLISLVVIGSLFIPPVLFSDNLLNNFFLSNILVWIFSPISIEILLAIALAVTIISVSIEKP
jgi:hypothetical protein